MLHACRPVAERQHEIKRRIGSLVVAGGQARRQIDRDGLCCQPDLHATLATDGAGAIQTANPFGRLRRRRSPLSAGAFCVTSASNALIPAG